MIEKGVVRAKNRKKQRTEISMTTHKARIVAQADFEMLEKKTRKRIKPFLSILKRKTNN